MIQFFKKINYLKNIPILASFIFIHSAKAQTIDSNLMKLAQNKLANIATVPFQNNMDFGIGPYNRMKNTLNVQPVIPFRLNGSWNLITRTIVPVIFEPDYYQEKLGY